MKQTKRMLCLLLAMVFTVSLIPMTASAKRPTKVEEDHPLTYHEVDYQPEDIEVDENAVSADYLPESYVSPNATKPKNQGSYGT